MEKIIGGYLLILSLLMTPSIMMWSMLFDQFEYELAPDCLTN
jgi:hypothetical protein